MVCGFWLPGCTPGFAPWKDPGHSIDSIEGCVGAILSAFLRGLCELHTKNQVRL